MFKLEVKRFFDASHQLPDSTDLVTKACANYHGHTYLVKIVTYCINNDRHGMVVDFKALKNIVDLFDHKFVNDVFSEFNFKHEATAENIARFIFQQITNQYEYLQDTQVSICEGYKGENNASWVTIS